MLTVVAPGPFTTVQDQGRPGYAAIGVGPAGAFDRSALALANRLVGNAEYAAGLEVLAGGLRLTTDRAIEVAVTGAQGPITAGTAASGRNSVFRLPPGVELVIGPPTSGLRSYLAVRGGIAVATTLESRSWDSLAQLGPPPLAAGDQLPIGTAIISDPVVAIAPVTALAAEVVTLRLIPGPRADWFDPAAWQVLASGDLQVSPRSDRVGIRLQGTPLSRSTAYQERSLPSEGLVRGAVEVPPDGQPIILGADHPTTGGYPVIGVISADDTDRCGQLVPGQPVRLLPDATPPQPSDSGRYLGHRLTIGR